MGRGLTSPIFVIDEPPVPTKKTLVLLCLLLTSVLP
jgi:hypothetical protein